MSNVMSSLPVVDKFYFSPFIGAKDMPKAVVVYVVEQDAISAPNQGGYQAF